MFRARVGASRGLRWGILALSAAFLVVSVGTDAADARGRHRRAKHTSTKHSAQKHKSYTPPYAAIVVDGNSGRVLHATNSDSLRHPASITKVMTLYLLFEQLEAGKLRLDSALPVSSYASRQAPSKLELKPGQSITVEDAIKALVTKSANDVAVVVAEAIGGSEEDFARLMTRKARALGMTQTVYANASGLPNDEQVTTARDQALLGRAIQDRFPRFYRYFATSSFYFRGHAIRNHNRLLGRVAGVDGIKTGYVHKSGFNLVTSVHRGNRYLVAVVMGGSSAGSRDARMRSLIDEYIEQCATERTAARILENPLPAAQPKPVSVPVAAPAVPQGGPSAHTVDPTRADATSTEAIPRSRPAPAPVAAAARPIPGSAEPIAAIPVKTLTVRAGAVSSAAMAALSVAAAGAAPVAPAALTPPPPAATQYQTAAVSSVPAVGPAPSRSPSPAPAAPATAKNTAPAEQATTQSTLLSSAQKNHARSGWMIQIGAFPDENEARERLQAAQSLARTILANADAFTERVVKGQETLFRARFAGLDENGAEAACRYFKRNKIACFAVKN